MKDDARRGIGAILIAFAGIGILLWFAATRLSPETTLSGGGIAAVFVLLGILGVGIALVRLKKR